MLPGRSCPGRRQSVGHRAHRPPPVRSSRVPSTCLHDPLARPAGSTFQGCGVPSASAGHRARRSPPRPGTAPIRQSAAGYALGRSSPPNRSPDFLAGRAATRPPPFHDTDCRRPSVRPCPPARSVSRRRLVRGFPAPHGPYRPQRCAATDPASGFFAGSVRARGAWSHADRGWVDASRAARARGVGLLRVQRQASGFGRAATAGIRRTAGPPPGRCTADAP